MRGTNETKGDQARNGWSHRNVLGATISGIFNGLSGFLTSILVLSFSDSGVIRMPDAIEKI